MKEDQDAKQNSVMVIHADDAGAVLKGLGISPNVSGGKLDALNSLHQPGWQ